WGCPRCRTAPASRTRAPAPISAARRSRTHASDLCAWRSVAAITQITHEKHTTKALMHHNRVKKKILTLLSPEGFCWAFLPAICCCIKSHRIKSSLKEAKPRQQTNQDTATEHTRIAV